MKVYYLVRHGLATKSTKGYKDKIFSANLLPEGKEQIEKIAHYLISVPTDFNISSEFLRCRQTVEIITKITKKEFVFDARLAEYYLETFEQFVERVSEFYEEMENSKYQNILVCTHGAVIAALSKLIKEEKISQDNLLSYPLSGELWVSTKTSTKKLDFSK